MTRSQRGLLLLTMFVFVASMAAWWALERRPERDWASASPALRGFMWPVARPVADFELRDQQGRRFAASNLRGQWSLLYFGYLQCPDVCPTTLQALHGLSELMAEPETRTTLPQMIFVTIDPGHDTAERIEGYLSHFDSRFIGLSGNAIQLENLTRSLGVMYAEYRDPNGVRSMDHTTSIIVVDPHGNGVAALPAPHQPRTMLQQWEQLRDRIAR